jgi:hypothetical protein
MLLVNGLSIDLLTQNESKGNVSLVWNKEQYYFARKKYWKDSFGTEDIVWYSNSNELCFLGSGFGFFREEGTYNYSFYIEDNRTEDVLTFTYPLLNFLVYLLDKYSYSPIHAAVIGLNDSYVLMPGKQNAGKSTTTASWALFGGNVISDDICFMKPELPYSAHGFYPSVRLREPSLSLLKNYLGNIKLSQKGNSKYFLNFNDLDTNCFNRKGKLNAIFLLNLDKDECFQEIGSKKKAYLSLSSSMAFTVHHKADAKRTMHLVKLLTKDLPIFEVGLSKDVLKNFQFLKSIIQGLQ